MPFLTQARTSRPCGSSDLCHGPIEIIPVVDRSYGCRVMITDGQIDCFGNSRHLVDIAPEAIQIKVIADAVLITLEVGHIHWIKTDQRGPQANIGFG